MINIDPYRLKPIVATFDPSLYGTVKAYWTADAITGLVINDPVSSWPDLGPSGAAVTNTGSSRPTYKTAVQNNLPAVLFNAASLQCLFTTAISQNQPVTVFAGVNAQAGSGNNQAFLGDAAGGGLFFLDNGNNASSVYAGSNLVADSIVTGPKISVAYINGGGTSVQTNGGTAVSGVDPGSAGYSGGFSLGAFNSAGSSPLNGYIFFILVYVGACLDIPTCMGKLRTKWAI